MRILIINPWSTLWTEIHIDMYLYKYISVMYKHICNVVWFRIFRV